MKFLNDRRRGQVLMAAVFVLIIVSLIGAALVSLLSSGSFSAYKNLQGAQALNIAEAGVRYTIAASLAADSTWSDNSDFGPVSLSPGTFTVHYVSKTTRACVIDVTGTVGDVSRVIRASLFKRGGAYSLFIEYGLYAGNPSSSGGEVKFHNNSQIIGNFFYFGPVNMKTSTPPPPCQPYGTIYSISIDPPPSAPGSIPDLYSSWEAISSAEATGWDNSYYDNWLAVAASLSSGGDKTIDSVDFPLNGRTYAFDKVILKGTGSITGPGTICAISSSPSSGYFSAQDNSKIIGNVRIIALNASGNSIEFHNNFYTTDNIEAIAKSSILLDGNASTARDSIVYAKSSGVAITLNSNNRLRGSALGPYGMISNSNTSWVQGLLFGYKYEGKGFSTLEGGSVFLSLADFYNSSKLLQNGDVLPSELPPGFPSDSRTPSIEVDGWYEYY